MRGGREGIGAGLIEVPTEGPVHQLAGQGEEVVARLGELHRGDTVSVVRTDGSVAVFTVNDVRRFAKSAFPTALVYGNTPNAALRLITCGGPFDRTSGHYLDNVVVTASLTSVA